MIQIELLLSCLHGMLWTGKTRRGAKYSGCLVAWEVTNLCSCEIDIRHGRNDDLTADPVTGKVGSIYQTMIAEVILWVETGEHQYILQTFAGT